MIGVDLGGTKVWGVMLDQDDRVVAEHKVPTPSGATAVVEAIVELVGELARLGRQESVGEPSILCVGAPCMVGADGTLLSGPNLPGLAGFPLKDALGKALNSGQPERAKLVSPTLGPMDVFIDNDANCAGWAERTLGAGHGADDMLLVTLGTGIGGGIVAGRELVRGAHGFGGEVGHMVIDPHGPPCPCGKRGCWERYASGSGLGRIARDAADAGLAGGLLARVGGEASDIRGEHVTAAAAEGDEEALAILGEFGYWVALGLSNLVEVFDPEVVVLAGGLADAGDLMLNPVKAAFEGSLQAWDHRPRVPVVLATLGARAGAVGAALVGRHRAR